MSLLSSQRRNALNNLQQYVVLAVKELREQAPPNLKGLYEGLLNSIRNTKIYFYDRQELARQGGFATMGEHQELMEIRRGGFKGNQITIKRGPEIINIPTHYFFYGDKITASGLITLLHEWGHFKKNIDPFAIQVGLPRKPAEEFLADILSAKVATKMGFKKEYVMQHYVGRIPLFAPFREKFNYLGLLRDSITPRKELMARRAAERRARGIAEREPRVIPREELLRRQRIEAQRKEMNRLAALRRLRRIA